MDELQSSVFFIRWVSYANSIVGLILAAFVIGSFFRKNPPLDAVIRAIAEKLQDELKTYAKLKSVDDLELRRREDVDRLTLSVRALEVNVARRSDLDALESRLAGSIDNLQTGVETERATNSRLHQDVQGAVGSLREAVDILKRKLL